MGFKEIYLLGCDSTLITYRINEVLQKENPNFHAYEDTVIEKKLYLIDAEKGGRMERACYENWILFMGYRKLAYICYNLLNIKLINCTSETLIDCVPRADLMSVLKKN